MTFKTLLRQATKLIEQAEQQLDDTVKPCDHCGLQKYGNIAEARNKEMLAAVRRKLDRIVGQNTPP